MSAGTPWRPGPLNAPHWEALRADAELRFQRCRGCGAPRLPAAEYCSRCLSAEVTWEPASGDGHIVSWVTFHRAYVDDPPQPLPYVVLLVVLVEGPRMFGALAGHGGELRAGAAVCLEVLPPRGEHPALAAFRLV
jgi:uncharacterized protein